jgi:hypothetical protein
MKRTDDFAKQVDAANVEPAKKTVAMTLVDACRPLENGGATDLGSLSRAFLAMVPLQLEQYLGAGEERITAALKGFVEAFVKKHADDCAKGGQVGGTIQFNEAALPARVRGVAMLGKYLGMNSGFIVLMVMFYEPICKLIESLATR